MPFDDQTQNTSETDEIERLVFSGGGAKGVVYPGAYDALLETGAFRCVKEVAGSSIGSVSAAMVAVGITSDKLRVLMDVNFKTLLGQRVGKMYGNPDGTRAFTKNGAELLKLTRRGIVETVQLFIKSLDRDDVEQDFPDLLDVFDKCNDNAPPKITFKDLEILNQYFPKQFKKLTVTGVVSTKGAKGRLQIFNADLTPDFEVALACRASCSIPAILEPVSVKIGDQVETFVDGGVYDNIPADYFDGMDAEGQFIPNQKKRNTLVFAFGEGAVYRALHGHPASEPFIPELKTRLQYSIGVNIVGGVGTDYNPVDRKQEGYRRVRDDYPLRTVHLRVLPIETNSFTLATILSRVMYSLGYLDTVTSVTNLNLQDCTSFSSDLFYTEVVQNFVQIYTAILLGAGKNPKNDALLNQLSSPDISTLEGYHLIRNSLVDSKKSSYSNFYESKEYSIKAFALSRAVEFYKGELSSENLFKETYQESFKRSGFFSVSKIAGECIFSSSTLERTLAKKPMFGLFDKRVGEPPAHTRAGIVFDSLKKMAKFEAGYQEHVEHPSP